MRTRRLTRTAIVVAAIVAGALGGVLAGTLASGAPARPPATLAAPHPGRFPAPPAGAHWFRLSGATAGITPNDRDFALRTRTSGPLLLFLPATGQQPSDYTRLLTLASDQGYHVLGLDYFNVGHSVASTCAKDAACYGRLQHNRFDGADPFTASHVDPANSILARLRMALAHLRQTDPKGGWGDYTTGDTVLWDRIVVAGHSQGGGISAWIAHTREVRGALMFGSPIVTDGPVAANWLRTPSRTPVSRMIAFDNTHDVFYSRIAASWRMLGLGTPVDVTHGDPSGHALITTLPVEHAHSGMAANGTPSTPSGEPVYEPVWKWMLHRFA